MANYVYFLQWNLVSFTQLEHIDVDFLGGWGWRKCIDDLRIDVSLEGNWIIQSSH
jgi:hypothetical protein